MARYARISERGHDVVTTSPLEGEFDLDGDNGGFCAAFQTAVGKVQ